MTEEEFEAFFHEGEEPEEFYTEVHKAHGRGSSEIEIYRKGEQYVKAIDDFGLDDWRTQCTILDKEEIDYWTKQREQHGKHRKTQANDY